MAKNVSLKIVGKGKGNKGKGTVLSAAGADTPAPVEIVMPDLVTADLEIEAGDGTVEIENPVSADIAGNISMATDQNVSQEIEAPADLPQDEPVAEPASTAKADLAAWLAPDAIVTVALPPGYRETSRWLVGPMGKNGHRPSFDKTKIIGFTSHTVITSKGQDDSWEYGGDIGTGATVTERRSAFKYRRLAHLIPSTPPALVAASATPEADTQAE